MAANECCFVRQNLPVSIFYRFNLMVKKCCSIRKMNKKYCRKSQKTLEKSENSVQKSIYFRHLCGVALGKCGFWPRTHQQNELQNGFKDSRSVILPDVYRVYCSRTQNKRNCYLILSILKLVENTVTGQQLSLIM